MNTIVLLLDSHTKKRLLDTYATCQVPSKNPYMEAFFKLDGASLSLYSSGKAVFQGGKAAFYAEKWGHVPTETHAAPSGQALRLIGTDEVGNGSYFGGLAVVASYVTPDDHAFLKKLGVDDSKKMTDQKICEIAPVLKEKIPHSALLLSPKKYNEVIESGYNAVSIKVALHNQAIYLLLQKGITPDKIVIDAFTSPRNYDKYLAKEKNRFQNPIILEEKAESSYLAVAVSSIIARAMFLENLENLSREIGLPLPSGAGKKSDVIASKILAQKGPNGLNQVAKLHFANTQKAQKILTRGTR